MNEFLALQILWDTEGKISYTLPVGEGDNVLVLSPHPDDEALGCGGAIIKMLLSSVHVTVAVLTDGNGGGRIREIGRIRREEFRKARSVLGYPSACNLDYPDGHLAEYLEELGGQLEGLLRDRPPRLVLTPYVLDYHADHQTTNIALAHALRNLPQGEIAVGMYEIWTPITNPNCCLNITGEYSQKRMALKCYQSQESYFDIIAKADALSTYRAGLSMRRNVKHMECFQLLKAKDYISIVGLWKNLRRQGEGYEVEYAVY